MNDGHDNLQRLKSIICRMMKKMEQDVMKMVKGTGSFLALILQLFCKFEIISKSKVEGMKEGREWETQDMILGEQGLRPGC